MSCARSTRLAGAIQVEIMNFVNFTGALTVEPVSSQPWASVTFSGMRHRLDVVLDGPNAAGAAADILVRLHDLEVSIASVVLADLSLLADARDDCGCYALLALEALTIDDD